MARPKKQTVEYFPHYVNSGKTMFILESNFGNDGYAFWFKVLELLGMTEGHVYDCRNTADWEFLLAKTHVSEDIANKILQKLADLDAIDTELWKNKLIWSDNFVKNLLPVYNNRKTALPQKPVINSRNTTVDELLPVENQSSEITTAQNTQSKVKESKVKESKVESTENLSLLSLEISKSIEKITSGKWFLAKNVTELNALIEMYNYEWVKEAVIKAALKGKYEINYAEGILKNWQKKGKPKEAEHGPTKQDKDSSTDPNREGIGIEL